MCLVCLVRIVSEDEAYQTLNNLFISEFDKINSCGVSSLIFMALGSHGEKAQRIALVQLGRYLEWFGDDLDKERILRGVLELIEDRAFQGQFKRLVERLKNTEELIEVDLVEKDFPVVDVELKRLGLKKFGEKIERKRSWSHWLSHLFY